MDLQVLVDGDVVTLGLRWVVPDGTTTSPPVLQVRGAGADWVSVPLESVPRAEFESAGASFRNRKPVALER